MWASHEWMSAPQSAGRPARAIIQEFRTGCVHKPTRSFADSRGTVRSFSHVAMAAGKVIIVGGGIGGLSAALALLKRGIDVEVYEQSSLLKEAGAGIQIGSNGTRVLYALGLEQALTEVSVMPSARELAIGEPARPGTGSSLAKPRHGVSARRI